MEENQISSNLSKKEQTLLRLRKQEQDSLAFLKNLALIMIILTIIYVVDEITSNINLMRPYMIFDLFKVPNADANAPEYANAVSKMAVASIPTYLFMILLPFYKALSDKFGRKNFLIINMIGMGLGMLLCMTAPNYIWYLIGTVLYSFFTPNDLQVIYIMEVAPKEHRATYCSVSKGIALLSVSLIGVLRSIFYDPNDLTTWRRVFIVPVAMAFAVGIASYFLLKETPVFLRQRIEDLENEGTKTRAEEIKEKKEAKKESKGGIKESFHFMFSDPQVRSLILILTIFMCAVALTGYSAETMLAYGQSDANMNTFYVVEPIVYAIFAFFSGFLTDWLGRKKSGILFGLLALVGEVVFVLCAVFHASPIVLAVAQGLMYGGLWSFSDLLYIVVPSESVPTEIRASVVGLLQYTALSNMVVSIIVGVLYQYIGSRNIGLIQLIFFVPFMLLSVLYVQKHLRETKDVDLTEAGHSELTE
ncbi:MAG: MFS transporter [Oscillospiraceae bacterium]|nr:MFS transporter [Oscillospiraceae bacterium]